MKKWFSKSKETFRNLKEKQVTSIIVDTCAIKKEETMKIVKQAKKVIILFCIIQEMKKIYNKKNVSKENITTLRNWIIQDPKSKKYKIKMFNPFSYADNNLIWYCIFHKKCILLTEDRELIMKAKYFRILYYVTNMTREENKEMWGRDLLEDFYPEQEEKKVIPKATITPLSKSGKTAKSIPKAEEVEKSNAEKEEEVKYIPKNEEKPKREDTLLSLENISVNGSKLLITLEQKEKVEYVLEREGSIKENTVLYVHEGDIIYRIEYDKAITIKVYEIIKLEEEHARIKSRYYFENAENIEATITLPSRIKSKAKNMLAQYSSTNFFDLNRTIIK